MLAQSRFLIPGLLLLLLAPAAQAHNLLARCEVLPDRQVRVTSWYDTRAVPRKARVRVFRGEELLAEGRLGEDGSWLFTFSRPEPLQVVVDDGAGHRAETALSPGELRASWESWLAKAASAGLADPWTLAFVAAAVGEPLPHSPDPASKPRDPGSPERTFPLKDMLAGLAFLLALAAFLLSLRNARELQRLKTDQAPGGDKK